MDIRTAEGTRIRRTFATKAAAEEAEQAMKPNPQQRAEMRKLLRKLSARSKSISASKRRSSDIVGISAQEKSKLTISQRLPKTSPNQKQLRDTVEPCIHSPEVSSGQSARPRLVKPVSRC